MLCRRVAVLVLCAALSSPAVTLAQEQPPPSDVGFTMTALPSISRLQAAIDRARFDNGSDLPAPAMTTQSATTQTGRKGGVLGRIVMASVAGVGGFLAGGYLGAKIEGPCDCDDPGFKGAIIGAPIGGAVGAIVGWKLGGLLSQ